MKVSELKKILENVNPRASVILESPEGSYYFDLDVDYTYPEGGSGPSECVCMYLIGNDNKDQRKEKRNETEK